MTDLNAVVVKGISFSVLKTNSPRLNRAVMPSSLPLEGISWLTSPGNVTLP